MNKPNFFIIGAPRCGTTALYEYLKEHPQIFMPYIKEPNYFCFDYPDRARDIKSEKRYLKMYESMTVDHIAAGEGSTGYLRDVETLKRIIEFNKEAKIIIMVRNPIDIAYSQYKRMLYKNHEDVEDFIEAWKLQNKRMSGKALPKQCINEENLQYKNIASVATHIKSVYTIFDKDNILLIYSKDFFNNTEEVYKKVLGFLNVDTDYDATFNKINQTVESKSKIVASILNIEILRNIAKFIFKTFNVDKNVLSDILLKLKFVKKAGSNGLNENDRMYIQKELYDEITELEKILNISLIEL